MRQIVIIVHDIRSCHNVGSLFRTAEGMGVAKVYLTGYTPYPIVPDDQRLPHIANKLTKQISKTALGAEEHIEWEYTEDISKLIEQLKSQSFVVAGLEQSSGSIKLPDYKTPDKLALVLGREVEGIDPHIQKACDVLVEIPMFGKKESFNVVQAAAIALYHCRFC